ncbi:MAG: hypothetical protein AABW64_00475 [Nanoarchaeota archaeon]
MDRRSFYISLSILSFIFGFFFLFDSQMSITGAIIGVSIFPSFSTIFGSFFMFASIILFTFSSGLEKIVLTSAIKKQPSLLRLTRNAVQDQNVEREINHLIKEFVKGNFEAGLGRPGHIQGTDISYLRGRKGGRLYYHKVDENRYEIVCKSAKGRNEDQVINALREIYRH